MGIDQTTGTDASVETADDPKPADRPPPPPDQPGLEPEGTPSRLEARKAAAANEQQAEKPTDDKPDATQPAKETSNEQDSQATSNKPESPTPAESAEPVGQADSDTLSGGGDASDGQPVAERTDLGEQATALGAQGPQPDGAFDGGAEQQLSTVGTGPAENETLVGERTPADGVSATDVDRPTQTSDEGAETGEQLEDFSEPAEAQPPEGPALQTDGPATERESAGSQLKGDVSATADAQPGDQSPTGPSDGPSKMSDGTAPASEAPETSIDLPGNVTDLPREDEPRAASAPDVATPAEGADDEVPTAPTAPDAAKEEPATDEDHTANLDVNAEIAEAGGENHEQPQDDTDNKPKAPNLMVGDKTIREHIDPAGAAAWSAGTLEADPEPAVDRIANEDPEKDEQSRLEKFRDAFRRNGEDLLDRANKATDQIEGMLSRQPPAGHLEVRTQPEIATAPHDGIDAGDLITSAIVAGALIGEGIRWSYRQARKRKEG